MFTMKWNLLATRRLFVLYVCKGIRSRYLVSCRRLCPLMLLLLLLRHLRLRQHGIHPSVGALEHPSH